MKNLWKFKNSIIFLSILFSFFVALTVFSNIASANYVQCNGAQACVLGQSSEDPPSCGPGNKFDCDSSSNCPGGLGTVSCVLPNANIGTYFAYCPGSGGQSAWCNGPEQCVCTPPACSAVSIDYVNGGNGAEGEHVGVYTIDTALVFYGTFSATGNSVSGASIVGQSSGQINVSISPLSAGSHTFTVTNSCGNYKSTSINVVVKPVAPISVSLSASPPGPLTAPGATTLTWTTTGNPDSCAASNYWSGSKTASGGTELRSGIPASTQIFDITCSKAGTANASASVSVVVNAAPASCSGTPWGTMASGTSNTAYLSSAPAGSCVSETRTCTSGALSGSYLATSCTAGCTGTLWGNVASGYSNTAYSTSSVIFPASCTSQTRTCTAGTMSGSYAYTSCSVTPILPTVTTSAVSAITQTTAHGTGTVTSDGGAIVTVSGLVWSTSANPTTANSKTTDGWAIGGPWAGGAYVGDMTGLSAGTTYHVRAYATNSVGTSYGGDAQWTTTAVVSGIDLTAGVVTPAVAIKGTPLNFSSTISNIGAASTGTSFSYFFQVATNNDGLGSITDLASSSTPALLSGANRTVASPLYTFTSAGNRSVRVCADKTDRNSTTSATGAVITESNEGNNCNSPWTNVDVSNEVIPINGAPGTANGKTYPNGTSDYGSDLQCSSGTSSNPTFPAAGATAYWQCVGSNGGTTSGTITPHWASQSASTAPVINATPTTIAPGNSTTLTWSSSAASCTASGGWSGTKAASNSIGEAVSPTSTTTYTITCGGQPASVTVTVRAKPIFIEN